MTKLCITLLAGGLGKRMNSELPKVLHRVNGEAMIVRLLKQILTLNPDKILIIVGKSRSIIQSEIEKSINDSRILYVNQETPLGTGHAVLCTLESLDDGDNIILNSDVPLLQASTILQIYQSFQNQNANLLVTAIKLADPTGNGRIIFNEFGKFDKIVEEKDCGVEKAVNLVNCGIYICKSDYLKKYVPMIDNTNAQSEYYLTDIVKIYNKFENSGLVVYELPSDKEREIYNVNTKSQLDFINTDSF